MTDRALRRRWFLRAAALLFVAIAAGAPAQPSADDALTTRPIAGSLEITPGEIGANGIIVLDPGEPVESLTVRPPDDQTALFLFEEPELHDGAWRVSFIALASGDFELGPLRVRARTSSGERFDGVTGAFALTVAVPAHAPADPQEYTGLLAPPANWTLLALKAILALVLAALLFLIGRAIVRKLRRAKVVAADTAPPLPPIDEALHALGKLDSLDIYRTRGTKGHYTELSTLLRRYFERQDGVPALEMTDDEVIAWIRGELEGRAATGGLLDLFARAGEAKYARWEAGEAQAREDLAHAARFLRAEQERLAIAAAQARLAAPAQPPRKEAA